MKSLRFASTKRIWKAIFIEETRSLCYAPSGIPKYFRRKCMSNMYFLGRNAFLTFLKETLNLTKWCIIHIDYLFFWSIMDSILVPKTGIVFLPQQKAFGGALSTKKLEVYAKSQNISSCFFDQNGLPNAFCWGQTQTFHM